MSVGKSPTSSSRFDPRRHLSDDESGVGSRLESSASMTCLYRPVYACRCPRLVANNAQHLLDSYHHVAGDERVR